MSPEEIAWVGRAFVNIARGELLGEALMRLQEGALLSAGGRAAIEDAKSRGDPPIELADMLFHAIEVPIQAASWQ